MQLFITILHIVLAIFMILIILLQPGKEGGAALAGGSSGNQMYGPRGAGNFLGRATTIVATLFMFTSISLAWYSSDKIQAGSNIEDAIKRVQGDDDDGPAYAEQEAIGVNLLIAKQRNGPTGDVCLTFFKGFTRFENAAKISDEDIPPSA